MIDGSIAERYGVVNRAFPDAELDGCVANLANEIAGFDRRALGDAKALIDRATLPAEVDLMTASKAFFD